MVRIFYVTFPSHLDLGNTFDGLAGDIDDLQNSVRALQTVNNDMTDAISDAQDVIIQYGTEDDDDNIQVRQL